MVDNISLTNYYGMGREYKENLRLIRNYPKDGIVFVDVTTLLKNPTLYQQAMRDMFNYFDADSYDVVAGIESRGFIGGSVTAYIKDKGFIPVRKPGKLPYDTIRQDYELEYGTDALEIHRDALEGTDGRVLIVDDLVATGGTLLATCNLFEKIGGSIAGISTFVELADLKGREKVSKYPFDSVISYTNEELDRLVKLWEK